MDTHTNPMTTTSHPSLTHLSTTPLSPSYPLPPTPPSPTLPPITPGSYISPTTTLPPTAIATTTSLLSRSSSRTKLRSTAPPPPPSDNGPATSRPASSRHHSRRETEARRSDGYYDAESSWLTRTASALAMRALEEKGQGWLVSRASATSLSPTTTRNDYYGLPSGAGGDGVAETKTARSMPGSRYGSRAQSRITSRAGSRSGSRVELRMTSQLQLQFSHDPFPSANQEEAPAPIAQDMETLEPDFMDLEDELEDDVVDGVEREEVVDEREMRRLVWGRVGGWVDWAVGWMDLSGDGGVEEGDGEEGDGGDEEEKVGMESLRGGSDRIDEGEGIGMGIKAPRTGGVWEDAKWLLKVAGHSV
ncbi:MAG: hypothetical protein LQ350_002745 [Teloschistes chrysophthalmus]|nr:MAG: hypothetical protein LQ350_002745 [Niorma chrysophthalma]